MSDPAAFRLTACNAAGVPGKRFFQAATSLTDMADIDAMNVVWDASAPEDHTPAWACS